MCVACSRPAPEDPVRSALRERLQLEMQLSSEELDGLRAEVLRAMGDQVFLVRMGNDTHPVPAERQSVVFGMLKDPTGLFDEGLRDVDGTRYRILNAPGIAPSSEIDAARRLYIDVETLLPGRFEFSYGFPSPENYTYELTAGR
jgi:hypothetical protein